MSERWKNRRMLIVGFGSIGQALLPLLVRHVGLLPSQIQVVTADSRGQSIATEFGIGFSVSRIHTENYREILEHRLKQGDYLLNLAVDVSSLDLIAWCQEAGVLYLDTCVEPWAGGYRDQSQSIVPLTNYALRTKALAMHQKNAPTAVIAHGANPGLVTHFVKAALMQLAAIKQIPKMESWAECACALGVETIQIAERDTQVNNRQPKEDEFFNTWSVDGLLSEAYQCGELGWGTHEKVFPKEGCVHGYGDRSGIFLFTPSVNVRVKTWLPSFGEIPAFLITHHESLSIANMLTIAGDRSDAPRYRPTVHYAYHPTEATCAALRTWKANGFQTPHSKTVVRDDLVSGMDQLGVLLVFEGGAFWYGSTLTLEAARQIAPFNNATSLQVVAGILGALDWMSQNQYEGVVEAESLPYEHILAVAKPFLGDLGGTLTEWQPGPINDRQFSTFRINE